MFLASQLALLLASRGQRPEKPSNTLQGTGQHHGEDCLAPNGIVPKVRNLAAEGDKPPDTLVTWVGGKALGGLGWLLVSQCL